MHLEAAAYGYGLSRSHPYRNGNKRVTFAVLVVFLELNGLVFETEEAEVVTAMLRLAGDRFMPRLPIRRV